MSALDPSSSSSSESEEPEESSSSSLSASSAAKTRRLQRPKKKKKKEKKGCSLHQGADSSTGNSKRIHDLEVSGAEINKALAPAGLSRKDRVSLVETAVDVAASPGVLSAVHLQACDKA